MIHFRPSKSDCRAIQTSAIDAATDLGPGLLDRVRSGELILTGYCFPVTLASRREVVPAALLEVLEIDFVRLEGRAPGLKVVNLQVLPSDPAMLSAATHHHELTHNADYSRVVVRGLVFNLSGGLCQIVRRLHAVARSTDPWIVGKKLLGDCGYGSSFIGDVFKRHEDPHWHNLIEGNGRGLYRLNLLSSA